MSINSNKAGSTPIFYYSNVGATHLKVVDNSLNTIYEFPSAAPSENGQVLAFDTDGSSSFVDNTAVNALTTDTPLVIPTQGSVIISDGLTSTGTNKSEDLIIRDYGVIDVYKQLNCNDVLNIQSLTAVACTLSAGVDDFTINNGQGSRTVFTGSNLYFFDNNIITSENVILNQGKSLTLNNDTDPDNVKLYKVNGANGTFFIDNQSGTKTTLKGASEYFMDNNLSIGDNTTNKKIYLNGNEIVSVPSGLLRAINCNLQTPTTVYNIVWSNLTAQEQLEWKGLDPSYADPVQSLTGNYWSFVKTSPSTQKLGIFIPVDLSALTFQDLESFWCVVRFNNNLSISGEGSLYFSIYTSPATAPNFYRTRINYQNPATAINQTGYFYKIHCQDTITTTTANNSGRAQEVGQTKIKTNPCEVRPDLWHIPFNKIPALSGDTSSGYTNAPILAISLQTASNIHTFDFDVVSIGYLDKQYNLSFA
jgi:hypothetical protein